MKKSKRFLSYLKSQKSLVVIIFIFALLFVLSSLSLPLLIGKGIDALLENSLDKFILIIALASSFTLIGVLSGYAFEYLVGKITQNVIYKLRLDVYEKINAISVGEFYKNTKGNLLQMEVNDIENVANGMFSIFKSLLEGIFTIIATIVLMLIVNWILAVLVIFLSPLCVFMSRFVAKFSHKYFKKSVELQSKVNTYSSELIDNLDLIKSFNYEDSEYKKYDKYSKELQKHGKIALFSASWVNPSTRLVNNTIYAIIGVIGIILIIYSNNNANWIINVGALMSVGKLSSFLIYINQYTKPFNEISAVLSEFETANTSFERINNFLNKDNDVDEGKIEIESIDKIEFKNVYFSYDKKTPLIENLNVTISKGQKIAIVGPTGAGKTTLINLIMRFYDIDKGEILINDINIKDISKASLRKAIGMVLQETWIFNGTVMDNVRYSNSNASDEDVKKACVFAHSDAFINTLPKGYQTVVGSKEGLSEGEKQMIAISRVAMLEPSLVILDEATSNIDTRSEKYINDDFDKLMNDKTSIVIAHRLSTITKADNILVINKGNIVEIGTHEELLKKQGLYYSMYNS